MVLSSPSNSRTSNTTIFQAFALSNFNLSTRNLTLPLTETHIKQIELKEKNYVGTSPPEISLYHTQKLHPLAVPPGYRAQIIYDIERIREIIIQNL